MVRNSWLPILLLAAATARGGLVRVEPLSGSVAGHAALGVRAGPVDGVITGFEPLAGIEAVDGEAFILLPVMPGGMLAPHEVVAPVSAPVIGAAERLETDLPDVHVPVAVMQGIEPRTPATRPIETEAMGLDTEIAVYGRLYAPDAVAHDRFVTPLEIWRNSPLGILRAAANSAAQSGDQERFEELSARFWELYSTAVKRRTVFGGDYRETAPGRR